MGSRRTPLFPWHQAQGAAFSVFGGFEMPLWYRSAKDEHLAVLTRLLVEANDRFLDERIAAVAAERAARWQREDASGRDPVAVTEAPGTVGAPTVRPASPPTRRTSWKVTVEPGSASSFSTVSTASGVTRYCLPPVRITA